MTTLLLAFNDCFRPCTPDNDFFEYGLWIPPDTADGGEGSPGTGTPNDKERPVEADEPVVIIAPEKVNEAKKAYEEKYAGGKATTNEIADFGREQGMAPSNDDVRRVHEKYGDKIRFEQVPEVLKEFRHSEDKNDYLVQFFEAYDPKKEGSLSRRQMQNLLANFGEPLTAAEIDQVLKITGQSGERVDYHAVAAKLLE